MVGLLIFLFLSFFWGAGLRNHYMIKEFLRKGEQYPGLDHLVPIDRDGHQIQDWVNSPLPVRRDYVPHEAILGKGMFGTVWRAMDSRSGQWYAVKKNHTYRQATVAREREVTNHVLMNPHPFIVQIFGNHFIESGTGFSSLVMEFCAGGDLQDKVNAGEGGAIKSLRVEKKTYPKKQATSQKTSRQGNPAKSLMLWGLEKKPTRDLGPSLLGHLLGEYHLPKEAFTWLAEIFLGLDAQRQGSRSSCSSVRMTSFTPSRCNLLLLRTQTQHAHNACMCIYIYRECLYPWEPLLYI